MKECCTNIFQNMIFLKTENMYIQVAVSTQMESLAFIREIHDFMMYVYNLLFSLFSPNLRKVSLRLIITSLLLV